MKTLFTILMLTLLQSSFAQDEIVLAPIKIDETITIRSGDTKIIPLPRYTFVDRVTFEVKNALLCGKSSARISFDGYGMQSFDVQGGLKGFRSKIIDAGNNARNIEITNNSNCKIKVRSINILPRRFNSPNSGHGPAYLPVSEAAAHVSFLLETFIYLDGFVGDNDRVQYISPLKKVLGKAGAILQSTPETSQASFKAITNVITQLNNAEAFIEKLQTIESTFVIAREIEMTKVTLERMTK